MFKTLTGTFTGVSLSDHATKSLLQIDTFKAHVLGGAHIVSLVNETILRDHDWLKTTSSLPRIKPCDYFLPPIFPGR